MNEEFQHIDDLERYTKGDMKTEELQQFEKRLQNDPDLLDELNDFQDMTVAIEKKGDQELWNELAGLREKMEGKIIHKKTTTLPTKPNASIIPLFKKLAVAASLILAITAAIYLFNPISNNGNKLYANFYKTEAINLPIILDDLEAYSMADPANQQKKDLAIHLEQFELKNYSASIKGLNNYLQQNPTDKVAQLYLGLSLMEQQKFEEAITKLTPLNNASEFKYQDTANWYLALCYLSVNRNQTKQKELLQSLINSTTSNYKDLAKDLLEKIK